MNNIDEQFVEFVVKSLVNKPDEVKIDRRIDEKGVLLELTVDPEDLGRVIGKRGATAQSIRTLLRALGTKNDARYNLKIIDNGTFERGSKRIEDTSNSAPTDATSSSNDDSVASDTVTPQDDDQSIEKAIANDAAEVVEEENSSNDRLSQTRRELEEFDDLDV
jgi:predicted RNA-binding protein YlqC (UPF0109 family)